MNVLQHKAVRKTNLYTELELEVGKWSLRMESCSPFSLFVLPPLHGTEYNFEAVTLKFMTEFVKPKDSDNASFSHLPPHIGLQSRSQLHNHDSDKSVYFATVNIWHCKTAVI